MRDVRRAARSDVEVAAHQACKELQSSYPTSKQERIIGSLGWCFLAGLYFTLWPRGKIKSRWYALSRLPWLRIQADDHEVAISTALPSLCPTYPYGGAIVNKLRFASLWATQLPRSRGSILSGSASEPSHCLSKWERESVDRAKHQLCQD